MMKSKLISVFRKVAVAEGISFLVLLLIAMPLKYFADQPQAVTIVGWAHGILFVVFLWMAFDVKQTFRKDLLWLGKAFLASIIPFGTFFLDRDLKKDQMLQSEQ